MDTQTGISEALPGRPSLLRPLAWTLAVFAASAVLFRLPSIIREDYARREPFFRHPIGTQAGEITIRNDSGGSGRFGASRDPNRLHQGIDISGRMGTLIVAAKSGRVVYAGKKGGYGEHVQILHPDGFESRYAHLSKILVRTGDWLAKGDPIGEMGRTGNANHPRIMTHLHFELRVNGTACNPLRFMENIQVKDVPREPPSKRKRKSNRSP